MTVRFLATILSAPLLFSSTAIASAQENPSAAITPCVERLKKDMSFDSAYAWVSHEEGTTTYSLINLFPQSIETEVHDGILSVDATGCKVLEVYPSGAPIPVTDNIPLSVAQGLTLAVVKAEIAEAGGIEQYQAFLNRAAQDTGKLYLDQNKVLVLQQLGVRLDPSIDILPPPATNRTSVN